jgi:hypothetical protein
VAENYKGCHLEFDYAGIKQRPNRHAYVARANDYSYRGYVYFIDHFCDMTDYLAKHKWANGRSRKDQSYEET